MEKRQNFSSVVARSILCKSTGGSGSRTQVFGSCALVGSGNKRTTEQSIADLLLHFERKEATMNSMETEKLKALIDGLTEREEKELLR